MKSLRLVLLSLAFALPAVLAPARAEVPAAVALLRQLPDEPSLYGKWRLFEFVDVAALRQASGVSEGIRLVDLQSLSDAARAPVEELLARMVAGRSLAFALTVEPGRWIETLGLDFLEVGWFAEAVPPPAALRVFGGAAIPAGDGLAGLALAGLAPVERDGQRFWVRGEADAASGVAAKDPGFPFWGESGSSLRLFRGERALVGARSWPAIEAALAVERGEAPSLHDLPRYRLAVAALGDPALSEGPPLQMVLIDEAFGTGLFTARSDPEGLPRYDLVGFAERQDASGHQLVLVLAYEDAEQARQAAEQLAATLAEHRGLKLQRRFPALEVRASVLENADGAAAVVRLATPPEAPAEGAGLREHGSRLFEHFYVSLLQRFVIDFLLVRE